MYRDHGADRVSGNSDDVLTHYLFDYAGRTVNAYTTDNTGNILGATNAVYSGSGSTDKANNRTLRTGSIGVARQQLLSNPGLEDGTGGWTFNSSNGFRRINGRIRWIYNVQNANASKYSGQHFTWFNRKNRTH